jgi:hypothetical protein
MREIALQHAALGLYVFPVARSKAPLTANGPYNSQTLTWALPRA